MLHGIDISNWQKGLTIPERLDFAIVKATGGTGFIDRCCDGWIQQCRAKGVLWGFYHFAGDGWTPKPEDEAVWFYNNTKEYTGAGIPVLDIEDSRIDDWGTYSQRFVDKYHAITGIWPMIYTSAGYLHCFDGYPLVDNCGLWVAGYPDNKVRGLNDVPSFPYSVNPWPFAAIWQYTSNGATDFWDDPLDLNVAYMDATAWHKYANPVASIEHTQAMQIPADPVRDEPTWTLENGHVRVDITLKGKE